MEKKEINKKFVVIGNRIRQCRINAGLRQEYVAEKVGISQKHLSRIERGYHNPHFETIIALANTLDVTVNDFLYDFTDENANIFLQGIKNDISAMSKQQLDMLHDVIALIRKYDI